MTVDRLYEIAEEEDRTVLSEELIASVLDSLPKTERTDLQLFLLLDSILPKGSNILAAANHDEVYLSPSLDDLAEHATEDQARVVFHYFGLIISEDSLMMFV